MINEAILSFHAFLASQGHPLDGEINLDSNVFHTMKCPHAGATDARYKFFSDGIPNGYFKCWRCGIEAGFCFKQQHEVPQTEWKKHIDRMKIHNDQEKSETNNRHLNAASQAKRIWDAAIPATGESPYLLHKKVQSYGLRYLKQDISYTVYPPEQNDSKVYAGTLLIPCYDANAKLVNLERIYWDNGTGKYQKRPLKGGLRIGAHYLIGNENDIDSIFIGEGYSTMATVHEAMNKLCVVSFNCGNLVPVAKILRRKYPKSKLIIIADNDVAGISAAQHACSSISGTSYIQPNFGDI